MQTFNKIILYLTILLSIATGLFKILQQPADILLFQKIGIGQVGTTIIGILQLIGGIALIFPKYRKAGSVLMIATFIVASAAVFANGMVAFGLVSLLFVTMATYLFFQTKETIA